MTFLAVSIQQDSLIDDRSVSESFSDLAPCTAELSQTNVAFLKIDKKDEETWHDMTNEKTKTLKTIDKQCYLPY